MNERAIVLPQQLIEETASQLEDPYEVIDETFLEQCLDVTGAISDVRTDIGFNPYDADLIRVLVGETHRSRGLHKNHLRKNGDPYYDTHLVGTVKNMIRDQHITGLPAILAGYKHDDKEDIPEVREGKVPLMDPTGYHHLLEKLGFKRYKQIQAQVGAYVDGVSKIKLATRELTKAATFEQMLKAVRNHNVRVGYIKTADRTHNMETLEGHGEENEARQLEIARETMNVYVPLAHILGIIETERKLIELTVGVLNRDLHQGFEALLSERLQHYLEKYRQEILKQFMRKNKYFPECITNVEFMPHRLSKRISRARSGKALDEIELPDLHIDDLDPMFDILVQVQKTEDVPAIVGQVVEKFTGGMRLSMDVHTLDFGRGVLVKVFNRAFGGRLFFRINDTVSEARSKRGVLANIDEQDPSRINAIIDRILREAKGGKRNIFEAAETELLRGTQTVYTENNDSIQIRRGGTPLDFAEKIHKDLLIGAQTAYISDDIWGLNKREISLFEELPPGVVVQIDSCLSHAKKSQQDRSKIKVDPSWLLFCEGEAKKTVAKILQKPEVEKVEETSEHIENAGKEYIRRICKIFQLPHPSVMACIKHRQEGFKDLARSDIFYYVGQGKINIVKIIAENIPEFKDCTRWKLDFELPNQPQAWAKFSKHQLGPHINIEDPNVLASRDTVTPMKPEVSFLLEEMDVYDFMKVIIKIRNNGFDIKATPFVEEKPAGGEPGEKEMD